MAVLLQIKGISKFYGGVTILDGAVASFGDDQKIGVIGRNGAGKSTLCKIITGEEEADEGEIIRSAMLRLSYLEQQDPFHAKETVLDFLVRYTKKEEWQCGEISHRFQITNEMLNLPIDSLAGGFRTRVKLAAMLLGEPNFLILDEPTNYLDLTTLILLENFLQDFKGGFLVVSHDREFLKRTCEQTLEVESGKLTLYPGSIEEYFTFKEEQLAQKHAYNKQVSKKKEHLQAFVDRFRAKASTASRAKSKMKQIARLKTIEIAHSLSNVRIRIPPVERKAGVAVFLNNLAIGYPENLVAERIEMDVERGARVAVLGDNGQGKTTLLRTIANDLMPKGGSFRWGTGLRVAYYAQHVFGTLNPKEDIFAHLSREAVDGVTTQDILNLAGSFLFSGDDVRKKIGVLSGGERARVVLAGILLRKCHVLLLDEPTNHLDFETVEALGRALKTFAGTVFFICHDRTFVNQIATEIIEVKNGRVLKYPGSYEDYVYHLERVAQGIQKEENLAHERHLNQEKQQQKPKSAEHEKFTTEKKEHTRAKTEITKLEKRIKKLESRLNHCKAEQKNLMDEIQKNPFHYSRARNEKLREITIMLEDSESEWMKLNEQLEILKK